jgi:hypothetical protein
MKCGNCRNDHETVAEVRACYGVDVKKPGRIERELTQSNPGRETWSIPEGHYAVDGRDGRPTDFYRVDRPSGGKWDGWTFLKMVVGGKPDFRVRDWTTVRTVLEQIQADPDNAAQRYGVELGQCSECNIHLTDELSRRLGIGPICREKKAARVA